jgi:nitrogen-specific signal transduction histidine kinase
MNIYQRKQRWKILLFIGAIAIGVLSLVYTNSLVKKLSEEEKRKLLLWADAIKNLQSLASDSDNLSFEFEVVRNNTSTPVILTDEDEKIISFRNLDSARAARDTSYLREQLLLMKDQHSPIVISIKPEITDTLAGTFSEFRNFIYYKDSSLLTNLRYYPYFQLTVVGLFIFVSYLAFNTSRKAEQNQVWVGMAKETAHQLGTPISSLIAWVEYLRLKGVQDEMSVEIEKDISRLQTITERFSKIGSEPELKPAHLSEVLENIVKYIRSRTSSKVLISIVYADTRPLNVLLNVPLFEWVIENLCKNAIDAMNGSGRITISVTRHQEHIQMDVTDTGKGLPKNKFKTIFNPGYTTKSRGWGLGLTLAKRIVEEYHRGSIFVKDSEPGRGTTFRILLKKCL